MGRWARKGGGGHASTRYLLLPPEQGERGPHVCRVISLLPPPLWISFFPVPPFLLYRDIVLLLFLPSPSSVYVNWCSVLGYLTRVVFSCGGKRRNELIIGVFYWLPLLSFSRLKLLILSTQLCYLYVRSFNVVGDGIVGKLLANI